MIYPPAALQFFANSVRGVLPIYVYSEHAGRGRFAGGRGGVGAGRGNPPASGRGGGGAPINTPASTAKRPSTGAAPKSTVSKRSRNKAPATPTRFSPRAHVAAARAATATKPTPRRLHDIAEEDEDDSSSNKSPFLLEDSQEVPGTIPPMYVDPNSTSDPTSQLTDYGKYQSEEEVEEEGEDIHYDNAQDDPSEVVPAAATEEEEIGRYDDILIETASDGRFPERLEFFLRGYTISNDTRDAVETCIIAQAGIAVSEDKFASVSQLKNRIVTEYSTAIRTIPSHLFVTQDLREDMLTRLKGGRQPKYGIENMWERWQSIKSEMKRIFTGMPRNFHTMKSGMQMKGVFEQIVRSHWISANEKSKSVSTSCCILFAHHTHLTMRCCLLKPKDIQGLSEMEIDELIHSNFWINKCKYILSVKVHRNSTEWTTVCTDGGKSATREEQRSKEAARVMKKRAEDKAETERAVSARIDYQSKSLQMQEAYASEAIKKSKLKRKTAERKNIQSTLKSLKEYKDIIIEDEGEEEYKRQVRELLWKLRHGDVEEDLPPLIGKSNEGNDSEDDDGYNIDNANNFQVAPV
jgi:hypothetical protein